MHLKCWAKILIYVVARRGLKPTIIFLAQTMNTIFKFSAQTQRDSIVITSYGKLYLPVHGPTCGHYV